MNDSVRAYYEKLLDKLIPELKRRNIDAVYYSTGAAARDAVLAMIPHGATVYTGGSLTLEELGIKDSLEAGPYDCYGPKLLAEEDEEKRWALRRQATIADYCLGSVNAIALTGEIVNIDGGGGRVGSYVFGGGKVILVTGLNKIAPTLEDALKRARNQAAIANAIRRSHPTLCAEDGVCHESECHLPERMCGKVVIIEKEARPGRITVVFVGDELGL